MKLFNGPLLRRRAAQFTVAREQLDKGGRIIANWAANWAECGAEGGQGQFLIRIFEDCLGYTTRRAGHQQYTLAQEISGPAGSTVAVSQNATIWMLQGADWPEQGSRWVMAVSGVPELHE